MRSVEMELPRLVSLGYLPGLDWFFFGRLKGTGLKTSALGGSLLKSSSSDWVSSRGFLIGSWALGSKRFFLTHSWTKVSSSDTSPVLKLAQERCREGLRLKSGRFWISLMADCSIFLSQISADAVSSTLLSEVGWRRTPLLIMNFFGSLLTTTVLLLRPYTLRELVSVFCMRWWRWVMRSWQCFWEMLGIRRELRMLTSWTWSSERNLKCDISLFNAECVSEYSPVPMTYQRRTKLIRSIFSSKATSRVYNNRPHPLTDNFLISSVDRASWERATSRTKVRWVLGEI